MRQSAFWVCAMIALFAVGCTTVQANIASQCRVAASSHPVVGCWESKVAGEGWATNTGLKGDLFVNIEKVTGNKVEGKLYIQHVRGSSYHNQWLSFVGTLTGEDFEFTVSSFIAARLVVSDNEMNGRGVGTASSTLSLKKIGI